MSLRFVHQDLMARFGLGGMPACDCGQEHRIATSELIVSDDALARSADLLAVRPGGGVVYVLSDENSEAAAGTRWKSAIRSHQVHSRILPASPRPVPSGELVSRLVSEVLQVAPALIVSIGGGVMSDLGKKVAFDAGLPNWCIATSASVDAYTSATSAIHLDGYHRSVPARASEVVVCDLRVIAEAPRRLFLSGLGDLLAKFLGHLDWFVAQSIAGDPFCRTLADFALGSARQALGSAQRAQEDYPGAIRLLVDAALVSGLAMQAFGSSRPAASAEHTVAHFWDAIGAVKNEAMALHGLEVGAATRLLFPGYHAFYDRLARAEIDVERRLETFDDDDPRSRPPCDHELRPFADRIAEENRGRTLDRTTLAARLSAFQRQRRDLVTVGLPLLDELEVAMRVLEGLGFPFSPRAFGIAPAQCSLAARSVRWLRNRYTTFDLAYELGEDSVLLDPIAVASEVGW